MRVFGLIGLVLALVIVGLLVKKQLAVVAPAAAPARNAAQQSRQAQEQVRQALDAAAQQQQQRLDAVEK